MSDPDWTPPPIAELRRVIPVAREVERRDGGRMIVASIEVWADVVVVHYVMTAHDFSDPERNLHDTATLTDDVGTEYHLRGGGGGGSVAELVVRQHVIFVPVVPEQATALTVASPGCETAIVVEL